MKKTAILILLIAAIMLTAQLTAAATIQGTLYDSSLTPIKDTILEINTQPPQKFLVKDGTYSFTLNQGKYTLTAKKNNETIVSQELEIKQEGTFTIDLFQELNFDDEILDDTELEIDSLAEGLDYRIAYTILALIIVATTAIYFYIKKKKEPKQEEAGITDTSKILEILGKHNGRMTQKELRKLLPLSEAKISLMITELEHKGQIEKIKKGRGNVIILK